jgi:hypothetical protein
VSDAFSEGLLILNRLCAAPKPGDIAPTRTPNGIVPPNRFVWDGGEAKGLTGLQMRLLECLCDGTRLRAAVPMGTVIAHVYNLDGTRRELEDRVRSLLELRRRTEKKLCEGGVLLTIDRANDHLRLLQLPPR